MGQAVSLGLVYCCFTAAGSLCQSCFGTTAPGTTGRKRAVLLLSMAIMVALWFQYQVGPSIVRRSGWAWHMYSMIPGTGKLIYNAWHDPCQQYDPETELKLLEQCAGNAGVFRPMFLSTIFFLLFAGATKVVPSLNREAWPAKYCIYFFALLISMFIPSAPLFSGFFLWVARFGAAAFVIMQQVILIDVAYNWNDDWVERANEADRISFGEGSGWLQAVIGTCVAFYSVTIIAIGFLYKWFDDCPENTWVITLTLLGIIAMTAIQLSGTEGSLLTSSVISLYATYLCFSIVSKNPNATCNPRLGHDDVWGITIGLFLTTISLIWTGWSWSAEERLNVDAVQSAKAVVPSPEASNGGGEGALNLDVPFLNPEDQPTTGVVTQNSGADDMTAGVGPHVWKLNIVMALISCYVAMILTGWGTLEAALDDNMNAANPTAGRINMAILGISQWLAIGLYTWTLVAPRVFPDRDFS